MPKEQFLEEAESIKRLCHKYGVPFIIDDDVELAVRCGADGIHVGQHDMEAGVVRRKIGEACCWAYQSRLWNRRVEARKRERITLVWALCFPLPRKRTHRRFPWIPSGKSAGRCPYLSVQSEGYTKEICICCRIRESMGWLWCRPSFPVPAYRRNAGSCGPWQRG